jgi:hypothetical protein
MTPACLADWEWQLFHQRVHRAVWCREQFRLLCVIAGIEPDCAPVMPDVEREVNQVIRHWSAKALAPRPPAPPVAPAKTPPRAKKTRKVLGFPAPTKARRDPETEMKEGGTT